MILTSYFTTQQDHHHGKSFPPDSDDLMMLSKYAGWRGLDCIVFHDDLSPEFVRKHSTWNVGFKKVPPPKGIANNDYRFFICRDWLREEWYDTVWFVDLFDVRVNRDPDSMLKLSGHEFWVGIHKDWRVSDDTTSGAWMREQFLKVYQEVPPETRNELILMAGTWGGYHKQCLALLEFFTAEYERFGKPDEFCDMAIFNRVMYRDMVPKFPVWMQGAPFHSEFLAYDSEADVCFVHK